MRKFEKIKKKRYKNYKKINITPMGRNGIDGWVYKFIKFLNKNFIIIQKHIFIFLFFYVFFKDLRSALY